MLWCGRAAAQGEVKVIDCAQGKLHLILILIKSTPDALSLGLAQKHDSTLQMEVQKWG